MSDFTQVLALILKLFLRSTVRRIFNSTFIIDNVRQGGRNRLQCVAMLTSVIFPIVRHPFRGWCRDVPQSLWKGTNTCLLSNMCSI